MTVGWVQIAMFIVSIAMTFLMKPKQQELQAPSGDTVKAPQIGEGRPIGVAFGEPWISKPTCIWYGDLYVQAIKKKNGGK